MKPVFLDQFRPFPCINARKVSKIDNISRLMEWQIALNESSDGDCHGAIF